MQEDKVESLRRGIQGARMILTDGVNKKYIIVRGQNCKWIYSTLGQMYLYINDTQKKIEELEKQNAELTGNAETKETKFNGKKYLFMPRLSGKTAHDMEVMLEYIKSGEPVVFISKDRTTSFKPVVYCKECRWRYTAGCMCRSPQNVQDDWYCSEGEKKK